LTPENLSTSRQADNLANNRHDIAQSRLDPIRIGLRACRAFAVAANTQLKLGDRELAGTVGGITQSRMTPLLWHDPVYPGAQGHIQGI